MLVLGIESATPVASVALMDETGLLGEIMLNVGLTHSEQLLPMIDDLLRQCRRKIREVTAIGVSAGPGSFTGLRIGMATAKGIVQGLSYAFAGASGEDCPSPQHAQYASPQVQDRPAMPRLLAIPTTEAMCWQLMGQPVLVSPMLNARREQIYTGLYRWTAEAEAHAEAQAQDEAAADASSLSAVFAARQRGKKDRMPASAGEVHFTLDCLIPPVALAAETWAVQLREWKDTIYLLGDGVAMYQEIWQRGLQENAHLMPPIAGLCRGSFVAMAAIDRLQRGLHVDDFYGIKPIYLRGI